MTFFPQDRHFWAVVLRRIVKRTHGRPDAEDLLHTAFLRLEQYRAQHAVEDPAAFLIQTAVNIGVDVQRRERFTAGESVETQCFAMVDPAPLQDEVIEARARLQRVTEGLARMSPRTRQVFLLHRIDGLKYRDIAERLEISQSAVEKHIAKASLFLAQWTEGW
jgi:RNA polymerase sigma-70 factor (ECF subfamily)